MGLTIDECRECSEISLFILLRLLYSFSLAIYLMFSIRSIVKIIMGRIYGIYLSKLGLLMMGNSTILDKSAPYIDMLVHFVILN